MKQRFIDSSEFDPQTTRAIIAARQPNSDIYDPDYVGNYQQGTLAEAREELQRYEDAAERDVPYNSDEPWGGWSFSLMVLVDDSWELAY